MENLEDEYNSDVITIKVVGVGGAGGNAINRMVKDNVQNVEFIAINTDSKDLMDTNADVKLDVDIENQKGLGAGNDPETGRESVEHHSDQIKAALKGANLVFIVAGEGGGTGTGGAPIVARVASELGALTIAVVTKPFSWEGKKKKEQAEEGIDLLRNEVDALIVIPNDKIQTITNENTSVEDAFYEADRVLRDGVQGITDIVIQSGLLTVDFADVKKVLKNSGTALMGIGVAEGDERARKAVENALDTPLSDAKIQGSTGALVKISASKELTMNEMATIYTIIQQQIDEHAEFIPGFTPDETLESQIKVTVIISGAKSAEDEGGQDGETGGVGVPRQTDPSNPTQPLVQDPLGLNPTINPSNPAPSILPTEPSRPAPSFSPVSEIQNPTPNTPPQIDGDDNQPTENINLKPIDTDDEKKDDFGLPPFI